MLSPQDSWSQTAGAGMAGVSQRPDGWSQVEGDGGNASFPQGPESTLRRQDAPGRQTFQV